MSRSPNVSHETFHVKVVNNAAQNHMHTRAIGNIGEDIGCTFLSNKGFFVVDRNYLKKWGELDIVAKSDKTVHFFEVKSVTGTLVKGSGEIGGHQPENNVHGLKRRSIGRMIETYMAEKGYSADTEFYFHVLCVYMDMENRRARVKWLKNIVL
jgi:putative endonuclease